MVDSITSFFAPKKPDTSQQQALLKEQRDTAEATKRQTQTDLSKRRRALLAGRGGRRSLFSGPETGTDGGLKKTLG